MNLLVNNSVLALLLVLASTTYAQQCSGKPSTLTCLPASISPTLDAELSEWASVEGIDTSIYQIGGTEYHHNVSYKCLYDETNIYFALVIPGDYRFNASVSELCASIATMFKIGSNASYINMGGCPDAAFSCLSNGTVPASCDDYRVDIGSHWELPTTQQNVAYQIAVQDGSGEDPVAGNNDEYAVSPYCRAFDDGAGAGNEWVGAWAHSNPTDGAAGSYTFELSRLLSTKSSSTDLQLVAGKTYSFGIAFWDPWQTEAGWLDPGHYITGCASEWIDLVLQKSFPGNSTPAAAPSQSGGSTATPAPTKGASTGSSTRGVHLGIMLTSLVATMMLLLLH